MTSKQLFPSSPEQVTLTSPGVWLTTKKRGRDDEEILRDGASAAAAKKNRRSAKGSRRGAAPKSSTSARSSLTPSIELSELTKDPTFAEVPESTIKHTEYSSKSEDPDFIRKRKRRVTVTPVHSTNERPRRKENITIEPKKCEDYEEEESMKTDTIDNQEECEISMGTMGTMNTCSSMSYSALAKRCVLLEKECRAKNKLINHYRAKIGEIVHSAIDTLMQGE